MALEGHQRVSGVTRLPVGVVVFHHPRDPTDQARARIGTRAEHVGSGGNHCADRRAVKVHEPVMEVLDA
jgi:hypothetical protein